MNPVTGMGAGLAAYLTFTVILVITPGSTTAVVVRNTLSGGRRAGLAAALGAATANSTHATLAGVGLSVLVATLPGLVAFIRVAGAAYLAWLGVLSLRRAWLHADGGLRFDHPEQAPTSMDGSPEMDDDAARTARARDRRHLDRRSYREGVAINMLNPAIISFYVAVVPSFLPAGASHVLFAARAAMHVGLALACHSAWATALHAVRHWFAPPSARRSLEAATGVALLGLAAKVVLRA